MREGEAEDGFRDEKRRGNRKTLCKLRRNEMRSWRVLRMRGSEGKRLSMQGKKGRVSGKRFASTEGGEEVKMRT